MGVQDTLARLRAGLFDLSDRNPLLNFPRISTSCLWFRAERPNDLYTRLLKGQAVSFLAAPSPQRTPPALDWTADGTTQGDGRSDTALQTFHVGNDLAALLRHLHRRAETVAEETGITQLFLIFGFLDWSDPAAPDQSRLAPLLLLPVTLKKASPHGALGPLNYSVEYSGEEIGTNLCLVERFRRLDIDVPPVADDDQPEQYVAKIQTLPGLDARWQVRRWLSLSLLPIGDALLFRDLDQTRWSGTQALIDHPLVGDWLEGSGQSDAAGSNGPAPGGDVPPQDEPSLIHEVDESQRDVLQTAMAGRNLVVHGPPGTGTARTIANLIAATIAGGKSVLFVAAPPAARDAVQRHLAEAGFDDFCLDVRRRKVRRDVLLRFLDQRLRLTLPPPDAARLTQTQRAAHSRRDELQAYREVLQRPVEGVGRTLYEVLWERELCLHTHPRLRPIESSLSQPDWRPPDAALDLDDLRRRATALQTHLGKVLAAQGRLTDHPWYGVAQETLPDDGVAGALAAAHAVVQSGEALQELTGALQELIGTPTYTTRGDLQRLSQWDGRLPPVSPSTAPELLEALRDPDIRQQLARFIGDLQTLAQERLTLAADFREVPSAADRIDLAPLRALKGSALESLPLEQFETTVGLIEAVIHDLRLAREALQTAAESVGIGGPITLAFLDSFDRTISLLVDVPFDLLRRRDPVLLDDRLAAIRQDAAERGVNLQDRRRTLQLEYHIPYDHDLDELEAHARALQSTPAVARLYSGAYRQARKFFMEVHQGGKAADSRTMADAIWDLRDHLELSRRFAANPEYQQAFGRNFQGIDTPFQQLLILEAWYGKARQALDDPGGAAPDFLTLLLHGSLDHLAALRRWAETNGRALQMLRSLRSHIAKALGRVPDCAVDLDRDTLDAMADTLTAKVKALQAALAAAHQLSLAPTKSIAEVPALLRKLEGYGKQEARIVNNRAMARLLGDRFAGSRTPLPALMETLALSEQAAGLPLPPELARWLLGPQYAERRTAVEPLLQNLRAAAQTWEKAWTSFERLLRVDVALWTVHEAPDSVAAIVAKTARAFAHQDGLRDWVAYLRAAGAVRRDGGAPIVELVADGRLALGDVPQAFELFLWNSIARTLVEQHFELSDFDPIDHERLREESVDLDRKLLRLTRDRLRYQTGQRPVPAGYGDGAFRNWTDRALLERATAGDAPHVSLRHLLARAGDALSALTPCVMMSPLAVAQYLPPGPPSFDLVIVDEAARLRPLDVLGAIARGRQAVLFGDPRQLPPTSFIEQVLRSGEPDALDRPVDTFDSALARAEQLFGPARRLRHHYRSRHESLFAAANRLCYDDQVTVAPSPDPAGTDLGITCQVLEDGLFHEGRNLPEAEAVVEAAIRHAVHHPELSLGIVALTRAQREAIEDLLERRIEQDRALRAFCAAHERASDSWVVGTVDTMQGRVRDVILVSMTYGRDADGCFSHRFASLEGAHALQRLSVLFTRATTRTEVFCSFDPDRLDERALTQHGLASLRDFLRYAKSRRLPPAQATPPPAESPAERALILALSGRGFPVERRVGGGGLSVDLAVRHSDQSGRSLLGLLLDGVSVAAGGPVREGDRIREERLRARGWPIHRIWSAAWYKDPHRELDRLVETLHTLLEPASEFRPADPDLVSPGVPHPEPEQN